MINDLTPFLSTKEFAISVRFSSADDFADIEGIFDDEGSEVSGVVIGTARLISKKSNIDKGWTCTINDRSFVVLFKVNDVHDFCEYYLRDVSSQNDRDVQ